MNHGDVVRTLREPVLDVDADAEEHSDGRGGEAGEVVIAHLH